MNRPNKKRAIIIAACVLAISAIIGATLRVRAVSDTPKPAPTRIFLTPEQNAALDKFDAALADLSKRFEEIKGKRDFTMTGIALSIKETAPLGLEWNKTFKEATVDGKRCLDMKTAEEIAAEKR